MSAAAVSTPAQVRRGTELHRFSVDEYHRMIDLGMFNTVRVELLEGIVVRKMSRNPPHDGCLQCVDWRITPLVPAGWCRRLQSAITLADSEPEPDVCIARGDQRSYLQHHPGPAEIGLVIEVSESTLPDDRQKARIYARAGIPIYWIVNLVDGQVEVYTAPSGPTATPAYANRQDYLPGTNVPLVLDTAIVGHVPVADLLP
jgi:Uma2 family endonuclease